MRVALDLSCVAREGKTGIGWYAVELVRNLAEIDREDTFELTYRLSRLKYRSEFLMPPGPNFQTRLLQEPFTWFAERRLDVFHGLDARLPDLKHVPMVVTLHDVFSLVDPSFSDPEFIRRKTGEYRRLANRAAAIIAVSEATRRDFLSRLDYPAERVHVVHEGYSPEFRELPEEELDSFRRVYALEKPYLLFVGNINRRKNTARMAEAFASLPKDLREGVDFVFCGNQTYGGEELSRASSRLGIDASIRRLGYLPRKDLPALFGAATAFVFPTLYEGFGLPILEAMASGTPVLTSDRSSHPEVAGKAALLVNPESVEDIAAGMRRLIENPALRAELRAKGLERVKAFSWRKMAEETRGVYRGFGR